MDILLKILFFRFIARFFGLNTRYFFYKVIGKPKSKEELSNKYKDDYDDYGNALKHDFLNALVGIGVFICISFLVAAIVF